MENRSVKLAHDQCRSREEWEGPLIHEAMAPVGSVAKHQTSGGHECEVARRPSVDFQTDCSVCLLVLRCPHLASCCGHNFCKECIERVQTAGDSCPRCRREEFTVTYNRVHDVALEGLVVYCAHRKVGCEWKGKLEMLEKHLNVDPQRENQLEGCVFVEVQCYHDGCGWFFQRPLIAKHQSEECPQRPFNCEHCHEYKSTYVDVITNHWPVCKFYPLSCPNHCTEHAFERQSLEDHLKKECPLQEVECAFTYAGCETKLPRKDMPAHLKETLSHMTLLAQQNQELMVKLLEKDGEMKRMTDEMEEKIEEKGNQLMKQYQKDMDRLEQDKNEQIQRLSEDVQAVQQRMCEITKRQMVLKTDLANLEDRVLKLQQRSSAAYTEVKGHITETERERAASMLEVDRRIVASAIGVTELKDQCSHLAQKMVTRRELNYMVQRLDTLSEKLLPTAPVQIIMPNFERHKRKEYEWYSDGFYTHPQGYKMCLCVVANGNGDSKGTYVSCFIQLMRGHFDDLLKWPFRGHVTIQLLNQHQGSNHHTKIVRFTDKTPDRYAARVTSGEIVIKGWGYHDFIPHNQLHHTTPINCFHYLVNDCLYFQVIVKLS